MNPEDMLEYDKLKAEQTSRIIARDSLINYNLVALGALATVAIAAKTSSAVLLIAPWISAILGWAYVQHEQKITSIGRYLHRSHPVAFRWEAEDKHVVLSKNFHSIISMFMILLAFAAPCFASPLAWILTADNASAWLYVMAAVDALLGLCITVVLFGSLGR
jgi:hypothetical protein